MAHSVVSLHTHGAVEVHHDTYSGEERTSKAYLSMKISSKNMVLGPMGAVRLISGRRVVTECASDSHQSITLPIYVASVQATEGLPRSCMRVGAQKFSFCRFNSLHDCQLYIASCGVPVHGCRGGGDGIIHHIGSPFSK